MCNKGQNHQQMMYILIERHLTIFQENCAFQNFCNQIIWCLGRSDSMVVFCNPERIHEIASVLADIIWDQLGSDVLFEWQNVAVLCLE